jgi:hypothetical protein
LTLPGKRRAGLPLRFNGRERGALVRPRFAAFSSAESMCMAARRDDTVAIQGGGSVIARSRARRSSLLGAQAFGTNEFDVAGGIMGRAVGADRRRICPPADTANAEMVIEGVLYPGDLEPEGPLPEFTGYYGRERSPHPVIEVKALHMRRSPPPP